MTRSFETNPKALFPDDVLSDTSVGKPWQVAHVKSRREKALADYLAKSGIGYYLPMYSKRQASQKRIRYSRLPVFSGYLFFRGDDFDRHTALRSNHIARIIGVSDPDKLVSELTQIQSVLNQNAGIYPYDFVTEGQRVRIKSGPLKDVEGRIVRKHGHTRLVLSVTIIMQSISVEIDADNVEPLK